MPLFLKYKHTYAGKADIRDYKVEIGLLSMGQSQRLKGLRILKKP
jgi:hypothetical protein